MNYALIIGRKGSKGFPKKNIQNIMGRKLFEYPLLAALNSKKISDFFDSQEVTLIKADWTQPNEKINKFLKKYNKFGIPFNAFYSSKFPEGIVMNEILTEKQIFETYNKVK